MVKTAKINLLNKDLEIILPRFYGYVGYDKENGHSELHLGSNFDVEKGYRRVSMAELAELIDYHSNHDSHEDREIFCELFLAYILERGIQLEQYNFYWTHGISVDNGVRREGNDLIIFKNLDGKIETIYECEHDTTIGYKIKDNVGVEQRRFNLERLFTKYKKELSRRDRIESAPLKKIDKSNLDLVEYLFQKEFENLPQSIQKAKFVLPPEFSDFKVRYPYGDEELPNIWPLSLDLSLRPKYYPSREESLKPKGYHSSFNSKERIDINPLILEELIICPYHVGGTFKFWVKEI